jgi:hypothetical protein
MNINFLKMSKKILFGSLLGLFLLSTVTNSAYAQKKERDKLLDKKVFVVELKEKGGKRNQEPIQEEVSFKGGKFTPKFMNSEYRFGAIEYSIEAVDSSNKEEKTIDFRCEQKNDKGELLTWEGTIYVTKEETTIEGFVILANKGKKKKEWDFTGTIKVKKGKR